MFANKSAIVIQNDEELQKICEAALQSKRIAFDTEFLRTKQCYYPIPSLMQFCYDGKRAIICDLQQQNVDWSILEQLLKKKEIIKIFHSAKQDVEVLKQFFGLIPSNIFDTQIAAMFLGQYEQLSYRKLVKKFLCINLDKELQFSDWSIRPLSDEQIKYAACDVQYLYKLFPKLKKQLAKKYKWAKSEMHVLYEDSVRTTTVLNRFIAQDLEMYGTKLTPHKVIIYSKIIHAREHICTLQNKAYDMVLCDSKIRPITEKIINTYPKLDQQTVIKIIENLNIHHEIAKMIANALVQDDDYNANLIEAERKLQRCAQKKLCSNIKTTLCYLIKTLVCLTSEKYSIAKSMIANGDDVEAIAVSFTLSQKFSNGWRYEIFGQYIEKLLNGKIHMSVDENMQVIISEK